MQRQQELAQQPKQRASEGEMKTINGMTLFFTDRDPLSNWYIADFTVKGVQFNCVEQFMMYCKAKLFADENSASAILEARTPRKQKELGRAVKGYVDDEWNARRERIVEIGCLSKFQQNPDIGSVLLSTGSTLLVEASPYDKIWGAGLSADDPRILDVANWPGRNLLGKTLSKVRESLLALNLNQGGACAGQGNAETKPFLVSVEYMRYRSGGGYLPEEHSGGVIRAAGLASMTDIQDIVAEYGINQLFTISKDDNEPPIYSFIATEPTSLPSLAREGLLTNCTLTLYGIDGEEVSEQMAADFSRQFGLKYKEQRASQQMGMR